MCFISAHSLRCFSMAQGGYPAPPGAVTSAANVVGAASLLSTTLAQRKLVLTPLVCHSICSECCGTRAYVPQHLQRMLCHTGLCAATSAANVEAHRVCKSSIRHPLPAETRPQPPSKPTSSANVVAHGVPSSTRVPRQSLRVLVWPGEEGFPLGKPGG